MKNKNIKVSLDDATYDFIRWIAKRDGVTITEELQNMFYLQLHEDMNYYNDEYEARKERKG